jgi:hypothetical protein
MCLAPSILLGGQFIQEFLTGLILIIIITPERPLRIVDVLTRRPDLCVPCCVALFPVPELVLTSGTFLS